MRKIWSRISRGICVLSPTAETQLAAFQAYQRRKGKAAGTVKQHGAPPVRGLGWPVRLGRHPPRRIENGWLALWDEDMFQRLGPRPNREDPKEPFRRLCAFWRYLIRFDYATVNPMDRLEAPEVPSKPIDYLHRDAAFLDAVQTPAENVAYLLRFAGCGSAGPARPRGSECATFHSRALRYPTVRVSKTDAGIRVIPVLPELRPQLEKWIEVQAARGQLRWEDYLSRWRAANGRRLHTTRREARGGSCRRAGAKPPDKV